MTAAGAGRRHAAPSRRPTASLPRRGTLLARGRERLDCTRPSLPVLVFMLTVTTEADMTHVGCLDGCMPCIARKVVVIAVVIDRVALPSICIDHGRCGSHGGDMVDF